MKYIRKICWMLFFRKVSIKKPYNDLPKSVIHLMTLKAGYLLPKVKTEDSIRLS